jgi:hypothetical protein
MNTFFSPNTISLIQTFYDGGLDLDDIMERLDLHDDFRDEVQKVIDLWVKTIDPDTTSQIQTLYARGVDIYDIMERLNLHNDFRDEVQNVIDRWVQACDDTETPHDAGDRDWDLGDLDYYPA